MKADLVAFLHRERNGMFNLYVCRGTGKKCPHKRQQKKKCDDCVRGRDEETIEQLIKRIESSDMKEQNAIWFNKRMKEKS